MISSQFSLDHRLAELRQAGADARVAQASAASGHRDSRTARTLGDALRRLFGGSTASSRRPGLVAH